MIDGADSDGDGVLDPRESLTMLVRDAHDVDADSEEEIVGTFKFFCEDTYIDLTELGHAITNLGRRLSQSPADPCLRGPYNHIGDRD